MKSIKATVYHRKSHINQAVAYGVASILLIMVLMQLFDFEHSRQALSALLPADMEVAVLPIFSLIVTLEVFALPYFLPFPLSKLARWCALACGLFAPLAWLLIIALGRAHHGANVPLLGSIIHMPLGFGSLCFVLVVLALVIGVAVRDRK